MAVLFSLLEGIWDDPRRSDEADAVMLYYDNRLRPLEWMDEAEAAVLFRAFRERRPQGIGEAFRALAGRLPAFLEAVENRPSPETRSRDILAYLAAVHNPRVFRALWAAGFIARVRRDPECEGHYFFHDPLHRAVICRNLETLRFLLEAGENPDQKNGEESSSPLVLACRNDYEEAAALLLQAGARADGRGGDGGPPLYAAIKAEAMGILDLLHQNGARIDRRERQNEETPLHLAASRDSGKTAEWLLTRGADPEARDRDGQTPLLRAARFGRTGAALALLRHGADPKTVDRQGRTPLRAAAKEAQPEVLAALLEHGAGDGLDPTVAANLLGMAGTMARHARENLRAARERDPDHVPEYPIREAEKRSRVLRLLEDAFSGGGV